MGLRFQSFEGDPQLLQSVLSFFDRFAAQNAKNAKDPRLMVEAARAYRKVARLDQHLGRIDEAEQALARAVAMFEDLVGQYPDVPLYRSQLVETYLLADPWSADPATLGRDEPRLRRARALADGLAAEAPDDPDFAKARVAVRVRLGGGAPGARSPGTRPRRASAKRSTCPGPSSTTRTGGCRAGSTSWPRARPWPSSSSRGAAATRRCAQLGEIVPDLRRLAAHPGMKMTRPVTDRAEAVAAIYETLGQPALAKEMSALAAELEARDAGGPGRGPGRRDRMRPSPRSAAGP